MTVGAFFCSLAALIPGAAESMGLTAEALKNAPFQTFLIPGLFLLLILSSGNLVNGLLYIKKQTSAVFLAVLLGGILMLWIIIQCLMLWSVTPLHVIFFIVGAIQFSSALYLFFTLKYKLPFSAQQN
ncbi:hypothetical protein [Enterococcus sp. HY326]|uniref:hypothetical protein n=1 Tax=Enterococcus sp. HY326 TaxID=2971265 RepID=UPI00223EC069|nr:hypothetical protein [Enterococcus sp. HY326]